MPDVFLEVQNLVQSADHLTATIFMDGGSKEHSITVVAHGFTVPTLPDTVFLQVRPLDNGKSGHPDEFAVQVMSVDVDSIRFKVRRLDAHAGWQQSLRIDMLLFAAPACCPTTNDLKIVGSLANGGNLVEFNASTNDFTPDLPIDGTYRAISSCLTFLGHVQWSIDPDADIAQIISATDANPVTIRLQQPPTGETVGRWLLSVTVNTAQLGVVTASFRIGFIVIGREDEVAIP